MARSVAVAPTTETLHLGECLATLNEECPSASRPAGAAFLSLWKSVINRPYESSNAELPNVLVLNREVAAMAVQGDAAPYGVSASQNVERVLARLGEDPSNPNLVREIIHPDEAHWLRWCRWWWRRGTGTGAYEAWKPASDLWAPVQEVAAALSNPTPEVVVDALFWPVVQDVHPALNYAHRLLQLTIAQQLLQDGDRVTAEQIARKTGADGKRLAMQAAASRPDLPQQERQRLRRSSGWEGYLCRRLAKRFDIMGYVQGRAYWLNEAKEWTDIANTLSGDSIQ